MEAEKTPLTPSLLQNKSNLRVLIVDDNEAAANTMGWMLELENHQTFLAFNGPEAIRLAEQIHPHVILLDIGLPEMSGYEVCEILRKNPSLTRTVFIAQTGWGQEEHRKRSRTAGFDHHLVKPVSIKILQNILNSVQPEA
jgi:CheY-like chemotaxis protein